MVIAAYAGTGKTTFCYENPAAIDLIAMPFKYINLSDISEKEEYVNQNEIQGTIVEKDRHFSRLFYR